MRKFKVATIQTTPIPGEVSYNLQRVSYFTKKAASAGADVVCLPEMFDIGYDLKLAQKITQEQANKTKHLLSKLAADLGIYIVAGFTNIKKDRLYNSSFIFSSRGKIICRYDKNHLCNLTKEDKYFTQGKNLKVIDTDFGRVGLAICFDLRFPKMFALQAIKGAKIIFVSSAWPLERIRHWTLFLKARALENQIYIVAANQTGKPGNTAFCGGSAIVDYDGEIIAEKKNGEGFVVAQIDMNKLEKRRKQLLVLSNKY